MEICNNFSLSLCEESNKSLIWGPHVFFEDKDTFLKTRTSRTTQDVPHLFLLPLYLLTVYLFEIISKGDIE